MNQAELIIDNLVQRIAQLEKDRAILIADNALLAERIKELEEKEEEDGQR